jgi:hypothetical protein
MELPNTISDLFLKAGWSPARRVVVPESVPSSHPGHSVLQEFGGLQVGECGAGREVATGDLRFSLVDNFQELEIWSELLGTVLVGIAGIHHGNGELYIDARGRCFGGSLIHNAFYFEGDTFASAAEGILLGRRARPLIRPNQEEVMLYGDRYRRGDPRLYPWS